jgi:hypothetical protein
MPRYFFHLDEDDLEGVVLPDDAAAHAAARQTFGEMIRENAVKNDARMRVCDADGRRVIMLRFLAE